MNFYFIDENNKLTKITGTNKEIYDAVIDETKRQKTITGFIGAIDDSHRVRSSLMFTRVDNKVFTKLNGFIRKYAAIDVLEKHALMLKVESNG